MEQKIRSVLKTIASMYHYLHMAQGNYRDYLQGEQVWVKKYFYVLRPLLAVNWLERGHGVVPTEFERQVNRIIEDEELKQKITALILAKKAGDELDKGPRISTISNYIDHELERLKQKQLTAALEKQPVETLNSLFRSTLVEVWGQNENF